MKIMDYIYKALGFETDEVADNSKYNNRIGEYNIQKAKDVPDKIDGIPVYYPENLVEAKELSSLLKQNKPFFINLIFSGIDEKEKIIDYFEGATSVLGMKIEILEKKKLFAILPEGVNVEAIH